MKNKIFFSSSFQGKAWKEILRRDVKPENIVYRNSNENAFDFNHRNIGGLMQNELSDM